MHQAVESHFCVYLTLCENLCKQRWIPFYKESFGRLQKTLGGFDELTKVSYLDSHAITDFGDAGMSFYEVRSGDTGRVNDYMANTPDQL